MVKIIKKVGRFIEKKWKDFSIGEKIKHFLKGFYSVLTVASTLTVLGSLFLYFLGPKFIGKLSDDDLTMKRIKKQLPSNLTITSICMEDLHGFGNDSIIVLAADCHVGEEVTNQLLILDKVENDILNKIANLFGVGSNYKLSYSFSLEYLDDRLSELGFEVEITNILELTGDTSKEIIVRLEPVGKWGNIEANLGGNGGYYEIGIFSYSFDTHEYYLLGTYPAYERPAPEGITEESLERNHYNQSEIFKLAGGYTKFYYEYFAKIWNSTVLIRSDMIYDIETELYFDSHRYTISVFEPAYHADTNTLEWDEIFSGDTDDYFSVNDYSNEDIENFLKEKYHPNIDVEKIEDN